MLDLQILVSAPRQRWSATERFTLDVTLRSQVNSIVLWGPSGCGKTSLLQTIAGLRRPKSGRIYLRGRPLFDDSRGINVPAHQRRIGYAFQQTALFPHLDVAENIGFGIPRTASDRDNRILDLARRCQIEDLLDCRATHISGGQAQRVAIARTLAICPDLLLLDEPFNALDPTLRATLRKVVTNYCNEMDIPLILVTHDRAEAEMAGEMIVTMAAGRIVESMVVEGEIKFSVFS